jgi:dihydrolipoamide dehydrogenase
MAIVEVKVPQLSESITEATLLQWKKQPGDAVAVDEILVELETDKVVLEVPAPSAGVLASLVHANGATVHADDVIATIDSSRSGAAKSAAAAPPTPAASAPTPTPTPAAAAPAAASPAPAPAAGAKADYDVVVIGGGPGGYIAAIRAAQLGKSVACIEEWRDESNVPKLGGTCLNVGCIPSKALLASSEAYEDVTHGFGDHGIQAKEVTVDLAKMIARKQAIVDKFTGGVEFLFRKNKITWLKGHGKFVGQRDGVVEIEVSGDTTQTTTAHHVIIATGSTPRHLPNLPVDGKIVSDNVGALAFDSVPKTLAVIGAGVIGLELGSVWRRLGAEVTVLEALPTFLAATDDAIAKEAAKQFKKQGLDVHLGVKIGDIKTRADGVSIAWTDKEGAPQTLAADRLIVSIGRLPNTTGLGLEAVGLAADERGFIPVDDHCRTSVPNIYAIGDVVRGPMLAHKAEDEGVMAAEMIDGQKPHIDYNCIPWVIYTEPEIAWVGKSEKQLKAEGREIRTGQFPMSVNGRALGLGKPDGFIKMIADATTDELLGVHIISVNASDLIAEAVLALEFKASSEDVGMLSHPHPSLSEVMREAALAVRKRALSM